MVCGGAVNGGFALIASHTGCVDFVFTALTYAVVSLLKVCFPRPI